METTKHLQIQNIKPWLQKHMKFKLLKIPVFALITMMWIYVITGSLKLSLIYFISAGSVLFINRLINNNKKTSEMPRRKKQSIKKVLPFVGITTISLIISLFLCNGVLSSFALLTWSIVYISYQKAQIKREWITGAIIPVGITIFAEFMQSNIKMAGKLINSFGFLLGLFFIIFVINFFTKLFNNKRIGYYIAGGLFGLLSIINFFVYTYTEQPFTLSDIKIATTAAGVLKTQTLSSENWIRLLIGLIVLIIYFIIITSTYKNTKIIKKPHKRMVSLIMLCGLTAIVLFVGEVVGGNISLYQGHMKYGFIGNFYITMNNQIDIPSNAKNYIIEDENDTGDHKPNVIIIMNEAFSDLETTFDIQLNEDPLKYFHSLQKEYPTGITYSSVKGNNTCSSEWELLSGSPTALTARGAMIYHDINKPMRSIVNLFNSRGYETIGYHPYYSFGYNRNNVYKNLGFNQSIFIENIKEEFDTYRGYITDEENYEYLIKMYEENEAKGDKPFFCFNITMQNHGAYKSVQYNDIYIKSNEEYSDVNTYLSGLKYSDEALKQLISYFETVDEDTIILFFGDHQPMVDKKFYEDIFNKPYEQLALEELKKVYEIPYLIWANYDLNNNAAPKVTSNNYLTNVLFEVGNIPKSEWLNMIDEYQKEYPVITSMFTINSQEEITETDALLTSLKEQPENLLNVYRNYSYGILCGKN